MLTKNGLLLTSHILSQMRVICLRVKIGRLLSLRRPEDEDVAAAEEEAIPRAASAVLMAVTSSIGSDLGLVGGLLLQPPLTTSCRRRFIRFSSSRSLLAISPGLRGVSRNREGVELEHEEEEAEAWPRLREGVSKRPEEEEDSESNNARLEIERERKKRLIF